VFQLEDVKQGAASGGILPDFLIIVDIYPVNIRGAK